MVSPKFILFIQGTTKKKLRFLAIFSDFNYNNRYLAIIISNKM